MTDAVESVGVAAPDANAIPEADKVVEGSEAESSPAVEKADEAEPVITKVQSRFDELTKHRREAERDRDYWRELAMRNAERPEPKVQVDSDKARSLSDFEFDEGKYQTYLFTEAEKRAVAAAERRLQEQADQESKARKQTEFERRESKFAKSVEDYHEVTRDSSLPISAAMAEVIADSEDGPALAYYLGKNIAIAEQISRLPPLGAARELGRIEVKLAAEREKAKEKPVSKAPPPTPKIEAVEAEIEKDPAQMTDVQFAKWRKRQIAQRS